MTIAAIGRHGARDRQRGVVGLRAGGGPALVRTALDAAAPLLSCAVLAGVDEAVLDAATTGSALVALLARLLAVDTGVLDLFALGSDASALEGVTVLVRQEVGVVALELTARHHVGVAHLVGGVELAVGVHLGRRGVVRVVASGVLLGGDFAGVVLSRVAVKALVRIGKVRAHLRSAVLAHLLLVTAVGLGGDRRISALVEVMRMHWWCHSVRHAA